VPAQTSIKPSKLSGLGFRQRFQQAITKSPVPTGNISIDGQRFDIRPNLNLALLRLRPATHDLVIWIDAICIDQENTEERNEQVKKMRIIYQQAREVRVWLGEAANSSELSFQFMKDPATLSQLQDSTSAIYKKFKARQSLPVLYALGDLFGRSYWSRVWIVQEVASAKNITVNCGADEITWLQLLAATRVIQNSYALVAEILYDRPLLVKRFMQWWRSH
jgi:hypothetical protein